MLFRSMALVSKQSPHVVVEAGCGVSTVVLAYYLEKLGDARLYSLEHDSDYAAQVRAMLLEHRLDGVAQVIDSSLKRYELSIFSTWTTRAIAYAIRCLTCCRPA